jgi:hypothetical protein
LKKSFPRRCGFRFMKAEKIRKTAVVSIGHIKTDHAFFNKNILTQSHFSTEDNKGNEAFWLLARRLPLCTFVLFVAFCNRI